MNEVPIGSTHTQILASISSYIVALDCSGQQSSAVPHKQDWDGPPAAAGRYIYGKKTDGTYTSRVIYLSLGQWLAIFAWSPSLAGGSSHGRLLFCFFIL